MKVPLVIQLSSVSPAAPIAAALLARRRPRGTRTWVLAWCAWLLLEEGLQRWMAMHHTHNLWLVYWLDPVASAAALWALSCWQGTDLARLTMRVAIVPLVAVLAALSLFFEDTSFFSRATVPLANLVQLTAAAYTLVSRSRMSAQDILTQDWFWVSAGMVLYFGTFSMIPPLSALLVGSDTALLVRAYEFQAVLTIAAFLAMARGMTCPATT